MRRNPSMLALACFFGHVAFGHVAHAQTYADSSANMQAVEHWEQGWNKADVALLTRDYADDADWTNAFGRRVQGRDSLAAQLRWVLDRANVRAGATEYVYNDLTFLTPDIALLRSEAVVEGQLRPDGAPMGDRHIHHLRVFERRSDRWVIVSHLISQAQERL